MVFSSQRCHTKAPDDLLNIIYESGLRAFSFCSWNPHRRVPAKPCARNTQLNNCEMGDDYELPKAVVNRLIKNAVQLGHLLYCTN